MVREGVCRKNGDDQGGGGDRAVIEKKEGMKKREIYTKRG